MTPERYMIDIAAMVVFGAVILVLDIWLRRRKRTSGGYGRRRSKRAVRNHKLCSGVKTVPCDLCGKPTSEWLGNYFQLCLDCCFQEYRDDRVQ